MSTLKKLLSSLNIEADYISLRSFHSKTANISVRNEILEGLSSSEDNGLMIEVMIGGQIAYGATNSFELSEVKRCAEKAKQSALLAKKFGLFNFSQNIRPRAIGEYQSPTKQGLAFFSPANLTDLLTDISRAMKIHDHIISRTANFSLTETQTHLVATNGSDIIQNITRSSIGMSATAASSKGTQKRTFGDEQSTQIGLERIDIAKLNIAAIKIASEALALLEAEECPNSTMDLILAPDQMFLQIHESIGHPLELDRILGDERNYAGWSFVKPSDFGSLQYGSKLMNVTFDPTVSGQNASYYADDTGAIATREYLIKDGLLVRGLGSLESQERLNLPGVSSQRSASWNRAPIDRMGNVNLEPGQSSFEEILGSVERGVMMQTTRAWSIDDYRNKFQFGCEYAQLIENGKLTKLVKNPNYRGITAPFWNQLKMVGDKNSYQVGGLTNCGKGEPNQIMYVGHASPVCLFSNIEVFGGGK
ncbi:MAG: TldD/PmbA family protein [Bacteriovorax sp.]|nr:TldD/PmbA family protein [Bacteriovorax sp.]